MKSLDELEQRTSSHKAFGYDRWIARPEVRALISMLPASEHTTIVMKSAYEAGFDSGQASFASIVVEGMVKGERK